jgi:hypothetical protein
MKALKILLFVVLGFTLAGALLLTIVLAPAVQRRVFLSAVNSEDVSVEVRRFSVKFGGVEIDDLSWRTADADVAIGKLRLKAPLIATVRNRDDVAIEDFTLEGLSIDLRKSPTAHVSSDSEAPTAGDPSPLPDAPAGTSDAVPGPTEPPLRLPIALRIARLSVSGEILLPDDGNGRARGTFALRGDGFAPGAETTYELEGSWRDPSQPALADGVRSTGRITLRQTAAREIEHIAAVLDFPFLRLDTRVSTPGGRIDVSTVSALLEADLAPILAFVPLEQRPPLTSGKLSMRADVRSAPDDSRTAEGEATLRELVGGVEATPFSLLRAQWTATLPPSGPVSIRVSLLAEPGGELGASDATLSGTVAEGPGRTTLDLRLVSKRVVLAGLLPLKDLFVPPDDEDAAEDPPDESPLWTGLDGTIRTEIAELALPDGATVRDLEATVAIDPTKLTVADLTGVGLESPFRGTAELAFDRARGGYIMDGEFVLDRFDAGRALQTLQTGVVPQLEGVFATRATFSATGGTLPALADQPTARFSIHGTEGVFRGLKRAAGNTSSVIGIIGAITRSEEVAGIAQLASSLANIPYEEVAIDAALAADRSVSVDVFRLRSTNILLQGSGSLKPMEDESFLRWPLTIRLDLGGKGNVAQLLQSMRVTAATTAPDGYTRLRFPFTLSGSVLAPDAGDLWRNLAREAATSLLERSRSGNPPPTPVPTPAPEASSTPIAVPPSP